MEGLWTGKYFCKYSKNFMHFQGFFLVLVRYLKSTLKSKTGVSKNVVIAPFPVFGRAWHAVKYKQTSC